MERKIGEIFEYEGNWYQTIEPKNVIGDLCKLCGMRCSFIRRYKIPECRADFRSDGKYVIYKKLEKVGDPYPLYDHIVQRYVGVTPPITMPKKTFAYYNVVNNTVDLEVKQQSQNTGDMETNEKTMPIPDGWEFDRIDDSGNIVLKEKKKELPKTFDKCWDIIETENLSNFSIDTTVPDGMVKPMHALCQLLVCRNAWWKQLGWKPDLAVKKYCITTKCDEVDKLERVQENRILAFPTPEVRNQFLETFRDLIEEAKELL